MGVLLFNNEEFKYICELTKCSWKAPIKVKLWYCLTIYTIMGSGV
jgi:hypothetical protein